MRKETLVMGTSGYLQSVPYRYWVRLTAPVRNVDESKDEWEAKGKRLMALLIKADGLSDVMTMTDPIDQQDSPITVGISAVVTSNGIWGAITEAAQRFFPLFEEIYGHGPGWTDATIHQLKGDEGVSDEG